MLSDNLLQKKKKTFKTEDPKGKLIKYTFILNMDKHVDSDMSKLLSFLIPKKKAFYLSSWT